MSQTKTIFKNMSWLLISQIITSICGFIWTILMARYLGVARYGIFGFAISLTGILCILFDFGIGLHSVRHIATDYDSAPKYLGNAIPLKGLFSIFGFVVILVVVILMGCDELTITVTLLFTIEQIIKKFVELINATFQSFEEGKFQGISNIILNIMTFIFILIAIYTDAGLYGIAISYIIGNTLALIYCYYILTKNLTKPSYEFDKTFCKRITIAAIPFAASVILSSIYYSIDMVMLTNIIGSYATGIYNATYKLINVLTLFYGIYTAVIFPVMSKFFKNDEKLLLTLYEKSIKYLMLVIFPIAIVTMCYSTDIIRLIYGYQYDAASSVLSILIWTVCLLFISGAGNTLLNASYKEVTVTKIYAMAAVFNVILNFILIPYLSYRGAAITTVLSDALIVIVQGYVIYKLGYRLNKKLYYDLMKILIGSILLGIALYFLNLNMWVAIPVGIIIYLVVVTLLKLFDNDDKYVIKEILGKN